MSQKDILTILDQAVFRRSYSIPHVIHEVLSRASDFDVMLALFKLQDDSLYKSRGHWGWFYATKKNLAQCALRSLSTVKRARQRLKYMGLIDYRLGKSYNKKATEYRILIDNFYLADKFLEMGSERANTKAMATNKDNEQEQQTMATGNRQRTIDSKKDADWILE